MFYLLTGIGLFASMYMVHVFYQLRKSHGQYSSVCDISEKISCTRVSKTSHSKTFGIPNGVLGIAYYSLLTVTYFLQLKFSLEILVVIGVFASTYLAYKMYKIKILCPICTLIHILNFVIFWKIFFVLE